jgi:F-type H+-transporting ATPase subunit b
MVWNIVSFFLSHEEAFVELNTNILETNLINLLILIGLLIYGNQISIQPNLELRQKEISQTIENAQKDVLNASNSYSFAEKAFMQSIFWLQSWKELYQKEKIDIVKSKYKLVKNGFLETFATTENLIANFEKKSFLSLQRYIIFITASRILRKFLFLSEAEQSKLIEVTISKLGGGKK